MSEKYHELAGKFPFGMKELAASFNCDEKIAIIYTVLNEKDLYYSEIKEKSGVGEDFDLHIKEISNNGLIITVDGLKLTMGEESRYNISPFYRQLIRQLAATAILTGNMKGDYKELVDVLADK